MHLGALDDTTARSVSAYLESRHADQFALADAQDAALLLVDLDQPGAPDAIARAREEQVVIGVGFDPDAALPGCRLYVQKPLTGAVVTDALSEAVGMLRSAPRPPAAPAPAPARSSHARDVLRSRHSWEVRPTARTAPVRDWSAGEPPAPRLDRAVFARAETLAEAATSPGSIGSVGEMLARRRNVEAIVARDGGNLTDPAALAAVTYDPASHLDGLFRRTLVEHAGRAWEIRADWGSLAYDPATDQVALPAAETTLRAGCHQEIDHSVRVERIKALPEGERWRRVTREIAMWDLSVWCSRGNLPVGLDPFTPVTMRAWPDLARGVLTPSVLPIVALLTSGTHRPVDVAEKIGVSRSHVFVVLAAAHNLGLLEGFDDRSVVPDSPIVRSPHRGIVRRLLGRLGAT